MPEGRKLINESEFDAATRETLIAVYSQLVEDDVIERGSEWLRLVVADAVLAMVRAGQTDYEAIGRYASWKAKEALFGAGQAAYSPRLAVPRARSGFNTTVPRTPVAVVPCRYG